jgi:hypothetical protein
MADWQPFVLAEKPIKPEESSVFHCVNGKWQLRLELSYIKEFHVAQV